MVIPGPFPVGSFLSLLIFLVYLGRKNGHCPGISAQYVGANKD